MSRVHLTPNPLLDQSRYIVLLSSPHTPPPQSPLPLARVVVLGKQERVPIQVVATLLLALLHLEPLTLLLQLLLPPLLPPLPLILMSHPVPPLHPQGSNHHPSQQHKPLHLHLQQCHRLLLSSSHPNLACLHMALQLLLSSQLLAFLVKPHHSNSHIHQASPPPLTCPSHMEDSVLHRLKILVPALGDQEKLMEILELRGVHFQRRWSMALIQHIVLCHHLSEGQGVPQWATAVQDIHLH